MAGDEYTAREHPAQNANRKQKLANQEELLVRKRSKTMHTGSIEYTVSPTARDDKDEQKMFVSPPRYSHAAKARDGEGSKAFEAPQRYPNVANSHIERARIGDKSFGRQKRNEESGNHANSTESTLVRTLKITQETLIKMIEDGASDETIENQVKIIEKLRARHQFVDRHSESRSSIAQPQKFSSVTQKAVRKNTSSSSVLTSTSSLPGTKAQRISSPLPSTLPNKPTKSPAAAAISKAKAATATKQILETAFPAATPTSLPSALRTKKSLTTSEVAKLSKVHTTFDETQTNKLDRHMRKINSTKGMASERSPLPERRLEARIRVPSHSPPEQAKRSVSGSGQRLDAKSLRSVSAAADASSSVANSGQLANKGIRARHYREETDSSND